MYKKSFFMKPLTIEFGPLAQTSGYDIHYAFPDDESADEALKLQQLVEQFTKHYQTLHPQDQLYITKGCVTDKPVGPWQTRMWELQISSANKETQPYDLAIIEQAKIDAMHKFMLLIGHYAKEQIQQLSLKGSLIIHANIWPMDSNMALERSMHLDTSWHVCGPKIEFIDVWSSLIAMENDLIMQLKQVGEHWYEDKSSLALIKRNFQEKFKENKTYPYENGALDRVFNFLINGQRNLQKMNASIEKTQHAFHP